jgi:hypothetical protein
MSANPKTPGFEKIQQSFTDLGIQFRIVDLSKMYPNSKARPRHYEIWFASGKLAGAE